MIAAVFQMTLWQRIFLVILAAIAVSSTRFLPFLVFRPGRPLPAFVRYLGMWLGPAVFGVLVVYCLRSARFGVSPFAIPEIAGCVITFVLQIRFRQMMLSMAAGTATYLALFAAMQ